MDTACTGSDFFTTRQRQYMNNERQIQDVPDEANQSINHYFTNLILFCQSFPQIRLGFKKIFKPYRTHFEYFCNKSAILLFLELLFLLDRLNFQ